MFGSQGQHFFHHLIRQPYTYHVITVLLISSISASVQHSLKLRELVFFALEQIVGHLSRLTGQWSSLGFLKLISRLQQPKTKQKQNSVCTPVCHETETDFYADGFSTVLERVKEIFSTLHHFMRCGFIV